MLITIDQVLTEADINQCNSWIVEADWVSGSNSAGAQAARVKLNNEMNQSCVSWKSINNLVVKRLYEHPKFQSSVLPSRLSAAFVSRYKQNMAYGPHIDDPVTGPAGRQYRSDVAITVFLTKPDTCEGGELCVHTNFGPVDIKLDAGSAVVYPASSVHEVKPVTSGQRLACVLWAQSMVRDPQQREILATLDDARRALQLATPDALVTTSVDHAYMNLVRMWAEV